MGGPHILISGATGFVGGACAREFLSRGWTVTALVHRRTPRALGDGTGTGRLHVVAAAVEDGPRLQSTLTDHVQEHGSVDAILHCAARTTDVGPGDRFLRVNVTGTANVVACTQALGVSQLVHVSTTDVYGMRDFHGADEETPFDRSAGNPYPASKIRAEDAVRGGLPAARWTILRPGVVWGPGDTTILPRIVDYLRAAPCIVHFGRHRGRNRWPLAYVGNVARAAYCAVVSSAARGQCFNLVDPERTTVDQYYRMLLKLFVTGRHDLRSVTLPLTVGYGIGAVSTILSNGLGRDEPVWHPSLYEVRSVAYELDFANARFEALLRGCGVETVPKETGLRELEEWARAEASAVLPRLRIDPAGSAH